MYLLIFAPFLISICELQFPDNVICPTFKDSYEPTPKEKFIINKAIHEVHNQTYKYNRTIPQPIGGIFPVCYDKIKHKGVHSSIGVSYLETVNINGIKVISNIHKLTIHYPLRIIFPQYPAMRVLTLIIKCPRGQENSSDISLSYRGHGEAVYTKYSLYICTNKFVGDSLRSQNQEYMKFYTVSNFISWCLPIICVLFYFCIINYYPTHSLFSNKKNMKLIGNNKMKEIETRASLEYFFYINYQFLYNVNCYPNLKIREELQENVKLNNEEFYSFSGFILFETYFIYEKYLEITKDLMGAYNTLKKYGFLEHDPIEYSKNNSNKYQNVDKNNRISPKFSPLSLIRNENKNLFEQIENLSCNDNGLAKLLEEFYQQEHKRLKNLSMKESVVFKTLLDDITKRRKYYTKLIKDHAEELKEKITKFLLKIEDFVDSWSDWNNYVPNDKITVNPLTEDAEPIELARTGLKDYVPSIDASNQTSRLEECEKKIYKYFPPSYKKEKVKDLYCDRMVASTMWKVNSICKSYVELGKNSLIDIMETDYFFEEDEEQ